MRNNTNFPEQPADETDIASISRFAFFFALKLLFLIKKDTKVYIVQ